MIKNFESYGTEKIAIGMQVKCGSTSLGNLNDEYKEINYFSKFDDNQIYVVIIRDVLERWSSGQKEEIMGWITAERELGFTVVLNEMKIKSFSNPSENTFLSDFLRENPGVSDRDIEMTDFLKFPEYLYAAYNCVGEWFHQYHSNILSWNNGNPGIDVNALSPDERFSNYLSLGTLMLQPNIYFLDLKDFSSPKFLKWLQNKDEVWKSIPIIEHSNKTKFFWENIQLFWKEYKQGLILKEKPQLKVETLDTGNITMVCYPADESEHSRLAESYATVIQGIIEYIRNEHERYIRL